MSLKTPLERAREEAEKINYCDECDNFIMAGGCAFCKISGKYLHPLMLERGQGRGPAYRCVTAMPRKGYGPDGDWNMPDGLHLSARPVMREDGCVEVAMYVNGKYAGGWKYTGVKYERG